MRTIRWGILGTGWIAERFVESLAVLPDAAVTAVGSRSADTAEAFGERYKITRRHASYADLATDPEVDVVFIGSPHSGHFEHSMLCLRAGKAVLCEKPLTVNAAEAEALVAEARGRGLFLMEAMWMRFLPHIAELRRLIDSGAIGEPRMLSASFSFRAPFNPQGRHFSLELAGGSLLDVGIYPLTLAWLVFGAPEQVLSLAQLGTTGVDEQAAIILGYSGGRMAALTAGINTTMPADPMIGGTEGSIRLQHPWWGPSSLTLIRPGEPNQLIAPEQAGNGYNYEAAEVMACLRDGRRESAVMPLDESVAMMRLMDRLRAQWGLRYPADRVRAEG